MDHTDPSRVDHIIPAFGVLRAEGADDGEFFAEERRCNDPAGQDPEYCRIVIRRERQRAESSAGLAQCPIAIREHIFAIVVVIPYRTVNLNEGVEP